MLISTTDSRIRTKRKLADEIVNNSAVLQDDDELVMAVAATVTYLVELCLFGISAAAADWRLQFNAPVGSSGAIYGMSDGSSIKSFAINATDTMNSGGAASMSIYKGVLIVGGTGGNLTFQWAQGTANVSDTTVYAGSTLTLTRV